MITYTVRCHFESEDRKDLSQKWLAWLKDEHISDVKNGGALGAEVFRMDSGNELLAYEIRYQFPDRATFERYESEYAPALREEGLSKFPLALGLRYERTVGEELFAC